MHAFHILLAGSVVGGLLSSTGCATTETDPPPPPPPGLVQVPDTFRQPDIKIASLGERVRVASYNIKDFNDGENDGFYRTPTVLERHVQAAAKVIDGLDADMVVIQEIENLAILQRLNETLAQPYPLGYITRFDENGRNQKLNIALLTRIEPLDVRELDFNYLGPMPIKPPRGTLRFSFDLGQDRVLLGYGVHLKSNHGNADTNPAKRKAGLELIRRDAEQLTSADPSLTWEVLITGDMNTDPDNEKFRDDPSLDPVADWHDLWRGRPIEERTTIPTREGDPAYAFPPAAFDRIIVSPAMKEAPWKAGDPQVIKQGVRVDNCYVHPGQDETTASDHFPFYLDLQR